MEMKEMLVFIYNIIGIIFKLVCFLYGFVLGLKG